MSERMILLTNDDGISAPGLIALKAELDKVARVEVYAPDRNWSAASRTRTLHKPLRVSQIRFFDGTVGHATSGTPADCVALALLGLLETPPDLVVAGINAGLNIGRDITYSGTVAAAMEGVREGVPSIAVSYDIQEERDEDMDYIRATDFTAGLASFLLENDPLPPGVLLNVNIPFTAPEKQVEVRLTRLGERAYSSYLVNGKDPRGRNYYWITGDPQFHLLPEEEGSDIWAIANGFISITPIHLDMTEYSLVEKFQRWEKLPWAGSNNSHAVPPVYPRKEQK